MKKNNMIYLFIFLLFTTILDIYITEARRIRYIIKMYKKGMELNTVNDLMKAMTEKSHEETKEFLESYDYIKSMVKNKKSIYIKENNINNKRQTREPENPNMRS